MKKRRIWIAVIMAAVMMASLASGVFAYEIMRESADLNTSSGTVKVYATFNSTYNDPNYDYCAVTGTQVPTSANGVNYLYARIVSSTPAETTNNNVTSVTSYGNTDVSYHEAASAIDSFWASLYDDGTR